MSNYMLPPPQLVPGLPRGNDKGGIFDNEWLPESFINAKFPTVPANSANVAEVPQKITRKPMSFAQNVMCAKQLTGVGAYVLGKRQSLAIPQFNPSVTKASNSGIFG